MITQLFLFTQGLLAVAMCTLTIAFGLFVIACSAYGIYLTYQWIGTVIPFRRLWDDN